MQWLFKIGNKKPVVTLEDRLKYWTDGQLVDIRPSGLYQPMKGFLLLEDGQDFWKWRGDTNWKSTKPRVLEVKRLLSVPDSSGKYVWETGYNEAERLQMVRHRFLDFKALYNASLINRSLFDAIYDKAQAVSLSVGFDIEALLKQELVDTRLVHEYSDITASVSSGTYQIGTGAGADYATVTAFEADIAAQLTGDLTGEHQNEETATAAAVTFDLDTNGHTLYLTAESGAEHNGGAYGNGARINFGNFDWLQFDETNDGDLDDVEVSKLAFNLNGNGQQGIRLNDGGNSGGALINRCLFYCGGGADYGIYSVFQGTVNIRNNIVYGALDFNGIYVTISSRNVYLYNNTVIGCGTGIACQDSIPTAFVVKNNLCQNNGTADYTATVASRATSTGTNVSEDATSPDAAYQSKDVHTNTVFQDYGNDDYRLDSGGDSTNLAILDDGEDLSGTFTDDIQGQTRATWYIGASEILSNIGTVCWGHDTGVVETNIKDYTGNWSGTGDVVGSGDSERLFLAPGEYMESETWNLGAGTAVLTLDKYGLLGSGTPTVYYKQGDSQANCEADDWHAYGTSFACTGWAKIRLEG